MSDWLVIIVVYAALFIASPLVVVLHELGHALAYLILTKPGKVDIYIGSYGLQTNSRKIKIGRFNFFVKQSFPFVKGVGLCVSDKPETNYKNYVAILLAGVCFTLFAAAIPSIIIFNAGAPFLVQVSCYIFLGFSALSLIGNLVPRRIVSTNGVVLESDGSQIFFTLKLKTSLADYVEARQLLSKYDFKATIPLLKRLLHAVPGDPKILRLLINASLHVRHYRDAECYLDELETKTELQTDDILKRGCLQSMTKKHDEAIASYRRVIKRDRNNVLALNNLASEMIEKGAHKVAADILDKVVKLKPNFQYAYINMGYSKILEGEFDDGKALIDNVLAADGNNAEAYKILGIYYLKTNDKATARIKFDKAKELDPGIDLDEWDNETKDVAQQIA